MLIERQKRIPRVRFQHPIRVVTLEGQPRVIRTLTANVSSEGLFLRMPEPLPPGMKVALSLEAGGRALALAQAEVVWGESEENEITERFSGCGVRFTEFMHPRAEELVQYLVRNLDQGKPLMLAPPERRCGRWLPIAGVGALLACAALATFLLWSPSEPEALPETKLELIAGTPTVRRVEPTREESAPELAAEAQRVAEPEPAAEPQRVAEQQPPEPVAAAPVAQAPVAQAPVAAAPVAAAPLAKAPLAPIIPSDVEGRPKLDQPKLSPSTKGAVQRAPNERVEKGTIKLTSGAAQTLQWALSGNELRLSPQLIQSAQVTRAFVLTGPPRAVFDLSGDAPQRSLVVAASPPHSTGVRLGKQGTGTRIVIDLDSAPRRSTQDGASLVLSF